MLPGVCQVPWKRCREIIEPKLEDTQCGFRAGHSTTDQIVSTLQQIWHILEVRQKCLRMFCRSRESIRTGPLSKLWVVFLECGGDGRLLLSVKSLYFWLIDSLFDSANNRNQCKNTMLKSNQLSVEIRINENKMGKELLRVKNIFGETP